MASSILITPTGHWRFRIVRRPWIFGKLYPEWRFEFDEPLTAPPPGTAFSYLFPPPPDGGGFTHNNPNPPSSSGTE